MKKRVIFFAQLQTDGVVAQNRIYPLIDGVSLFRSNNVSID
jgi:hypothetical protein